MLAAFSTSLDTRLGGHLIFLRVFRFVLDRTSKKGISDCEQQQYENSTTFCEDRNSIGKA